MSFTSRKDRGPGGEERKTEERPIRSAVDFSRRFFPESHRVCPRCGGTGVDRGVDPRKFVSPPRPVSEEE